MTAYVALLRGINVGGNKKVAMADLRSLGARLGFVDVKSLLNSGNLVFQGGGQPTARLESLLESETQQRLGLQTDFYVRTAPEWEQVIDANPFPAEALSDPGHFVAMFLKRPVGAKEVKALQAAITGREVVRGAGREIYLIFPDGIGRSRLTNAVIERRLGSHGTARNWNTILKLGALLRGVRP
ncbi:MAG TPA: DUF1697 domain-containing protein [Acidobacteriota bacterium]|nr:DUF1697 domain-containing protein [Acidobacteriota bacterium]